MKSPNRVLNNQDRLDYMPTIDLMFQLCPEMMARKIPEANVQQAFVYDMVNSILSVESIKYPLLCVGSFEDTACATLKAVGVDVVEIDPDVNGMDLHTFYGQSNSGFDIIFSTSVIEHVRNDGQFIDEICKLLNPGGYAILTTDFRDDYTPTMPLPYTDERFYTEKDFKFRLGRIIEANGCQFLGEPRWEGKPDFFYQGHTYSFATLVFRKTANV